MHTRRDVTQTHALPQAYVKPTKNKHLVKNSARFPGYKKNNKHARALPKRFIAGVSRGKEENRVR